MPQPHASSNSALAFDEVPRGTGTSGATEQIARALRESGIDAPSGLYDEALALARDGHLSPAAERLRMLLCLDPTDAEASLLLGKILASRGQYQEALANLDAAVTHGAVLPPGLRDRVEAGLHKQIRDAEEHRARVAARERGEVHALRDEAKKLRSENAALELEVDELQRRVRLWSSATAISIGVTAALLLASLIFGGDDHPDADAPSADSPAAHATGDASTATTEPVVLTPTPTTVASAKGSASTATTPAATTGTGTVALDTVPAAGTAAAPAATTGTASAPTAAPVRTHVVQKGDTLGKLAQRYYGNSGLWPTIQAANRDLLGDGVALKIGMKLKIPPKP
ncbi:MAG: LysM peptidoglycan-binding domain-containing protein [Deltaproteobacteria bacterium]|nr:MAG: LysM peptidoglycan-binding domain-containing protein [Deltaproteobacteria bacterium]